MWLTERKNKGFSNKKSFKKKITLKFVQPKGFESWQYIDTTIKDAVLGFPPPPPPSEHTFYYGKYNQLISIMRFNNLLDLVLVLPD